MAVRTRIFLSNKTQAVRLPKAVSMPHGVDEVEIVAIGNTRVITPAGQCWDAWFAGGGASDDFMADREQPVEQEREPLD
jgi:antitoxin VapB